MRKEKHRGICASGRKTDTRLVGDNQTTIPIASASNTRIIALKIESMRLVTLKRWNPIFQPNQNDIGRDEHEHTHDSNDRLRKPTELNSHHHDKTPH